MTTYTSEQKAQYYRDLRAKWAMTKLMADKDTVAKGKYDRLNMKVSYYSFFFTYMQMKALGLKGIPYIDCKTFKGWQDSGFKVKKGEHSKIEGIVWLEIKDKEADEDDPVEFLLPKIYHLFHKSQVEKR